MPDSHGQPPKVAPFTGAWIEILDVSQHRTDGLSLPSRERGLKFSAALSKSIISIVAPFTGAWIEIV